MTLTREEKDKLVELNQTRIKNAQKLPYIQIQPALDKFVFDLNICLTINDEAFLDLSIMAVDYIEESDRILLN